MSNTTNTFTTIRQGIMSDEQVSGELKELRRFFPKIAQDGE